MSVEQTTGAYIKDWESYVLVVLQVFTIDETPLSSHDFVQTVLETFLLQISNDFIFHARHAT